MLARNARWITPLALLAAAACAYGLFTFQHGFHWDDWGFVWLIRRLGRPGLFDYFSTNRPFLAYVYSLTTALLGTAPWAWQLFSLACRWASALACYHLLRTLWPGRRAEATLAAVLFLVYPGFDQQAIAITYSHFFLAETMLLLSLALALPFARDPRRNWPAGLLALALALYNLFSTEYFYGLELLRPAVLWLGLRQALPDNAARLRRTALAYLPFALAVAAYTYWRYFVLGFTLYQPELVTGLESSALARLAALPGAVLAQWRAALGEAWLATLQFPDFAAYGPRLSTVYLAALLLAGTGMYRLLATRWSAQVESARITPAWLGLGVLAALLAGVPFLVADLPVRLGFPYSRFTLPFAFGSTLLATWLLGALPLRARLALASLLASLAIGLQFHTGYLWREDWQRVRAFFWQVAWRVPDLEPGTILLSSDTPFDYSSDNSLTFPLNLIYASQEAPGAIEHAYFFVSVRLGNELAALEPGLPVRQDYLAASFESSSDRVVAVHYNPPGCFRVLDPRYDRDLPLAPGDAQSSTRWLEAGVPALPRTAGLALPLSNPAQIRLGEPPALPAPFGPEPERGWCYYFERADLARQSGDWDGVAALGDLAFAASYQADDASEYLPFIEAYARTGRWEAARDLTRRTAELAPVLRPALCAAWRRAGDQPDAGLTGDQVEKMMAELGCCPYQEE